MADRLVAVTDSSPVITLCSVAQLRLLEQLFLRVLVPTEVALELAAKPGATEGIALGALWNVEYRSSAVEAPADAAHLDAGERAVIALAVERPGSVVIVDDHQARQVAKSLGVRAVGTLGILIEAKRQHRLLLVAPIVHAMVAKGARFGPALVERVLRAVGEAESAPSA